eukprot:5992710-Karenia_brevis.AAC.1
METWQPRWVDMETCLSEEFDQALLDILGRRVSCSSQARICRRARPGVAENLPDARFWSQQ